MSLIVLNLEVARLLLAGRTHEDAADGAHVVVVPSVADGDVAVVGVAAVRGIEADPAAPGEVDIDPGVGGLGLDAASLGRPVEEVAADVAAAPAPAAKQGEECVREILSDARAEFEEFLDRRARVRPPDGVAEALGHPGEGRFDGEPAAPFASDRPTEGID